MIAMSSVAMSDNLNHGEIWEISRKLSKAQLGWIADKPGKLLSPAIGSESEGFAGYQRFWSFAVMFGSVQKVQYLKIFKVWFWVNQHLRIRSPLCFNFSTCRSVARHCQDFDVAGYFETHPALLKRKATNPPAPCCLHRSQRSSKISELPIKQPVKMSFTPWDLRLLNKLEKYTISNF